MPDLQYFQLTLKFIQYTPVSKILGRDTLLHFFRFLPLFLCQVRVLLLGSTRTAALESKNLPH
jgi:hypothetical protein